MIIGSFALIRPFTSLETQFAAIRELGITHADITDNHDGATLGTEYGFAASASLEAHPRVIRDMAKAHGISLTSVCAHANLLDPTSPDSIKHSKSLRPSSLRITSASAKSSPPKATPKLPLVNRLLLPSASFPLRKNCMSRCLGRKNLGSNYSLSRMGR
jgi:hypothetical protein